MPQFHKWKSINKFSDAFAKAQKYNVKKFSYRGKIKLHGTNAGIHFEDGIAYPQKRSDFITIQSTPRKPSCFGSGMNWRL